MSLSLRSLTVVALPLAVLGGLAWLLSGSPEPAVIPSPVSGWVSMDLAGAVAADKIQGWDVRRGTYHLGQVDGRKVLELRPEPIVEGKVLWMKPMRGGGGVRARMRGDPARRAWPRFSVGLHQTRELHLRAFPGERKMELVACDGDLTNEMVLAALVLPDWKSEHGEWIWLELVAVRQPEDEFLYEGRFWLDGQPRPPQPSLTTRLRSEDGIFHAALQGAPYALRPILIDQAETWTPPAGG